MTGRAVTTIDELPILHFGAILADCAWDFENWSKKGELKNAKRHYRCMKLPEIKALNVGHLASKDCVLVMWATWPMLLQALEVMAAWGFKWCTGGAWGKRSKTGRKWHFGTGYVLRSACEPFLVGTNGSPERLNKDIRNFIEAPVREHSRKPDEMYDIVERLTPGPYVELFARQQREGWWAMGDEVGRFAA